MDTAGIGSELTGKKDQQEVPSNESNSRKRKNRWDVGGAAPAPPPVAPVVSPATPTSPLPAVRTPPLSTPSASSVSSAPLLPTIGVVPNALLANQAAIAAAMKLAKQPVLSDTYQPGMVRVGTKWMFPDQEDTDGGTYEHKKRMKEMRETEEKAQILTELAMKKGAHHISDFLPQTELAKFQTKVQEIKRGGSLEPEDDYQSFKLGEDNKGFKLLKQAGWTEGKGLGATESGIIAPISGTTMRPGNTGLGQEQAHEVTEDDDEFELYRKRMMLAYRYRPNPLNNPRRPYY